jgi:hypothetical protein
LKKSAQTLVALLRYDGGSVREEAQCHFGPKRHAGGASVDDADAIVVVQLVIVIISKTGARDGRWDGPGPGQSRDNLLRHPSEHRVGALKHRHGSAGNHDGRQERTPGFGTATDRRECRYVLLQERHGPLTEGQDGTTAGRSAFQVARAPIEELTVWP